MEGDTNFEWKTFPCSAEANCIICVTWLFQVDCKDKNSLSLQKPIATQAIRCSYKSLFLYNSPTENGQILKEEKKEWIFYGNYKEQKILSIVSFFMQISQNKACFLLPPQNTFNQQFVQSRLNPCHTHYFKKSIDRSKMKILFNKLKKQNILQPYRSYVYLILIYKVSREWQNILLGKMTISFHWIEI